MLSKSERTRLYIIEKAAHLFNKKGFHGTSMSDILEVTGLAKGGVYGNFKSKEEIVIEAFDYSFRKVADELAIRIKSRDNAPDKLIAIIDYYYNYISRPPIEGGCPILNYTGFIEDSSPELKRAVLKATRLMLDTVVKILEKGQKYQQIRKSIDAEAAADIIYSRIEGAIMLAKATGDESRLARLLNDLKVYIIKEYKI